MTKIECLKILERIALVANQTFGKQEVAFYVSRLEKYGWNRVFGALETLEKTWRGLPSAAKVELVTIETPPAYDEDDPEGPRVDANGRYHLSRWTVERHGGTWTKRPFDKQTLTLISAGERNRQK